MYFSQSFTDIFHCIVFLLYLLINLFIIIFWADTVCSRKSNRNKDSSWKSFIRAGYETSAATECQGTEHALIVQTTQELQVWVQVLAGLSLRVLKKLRQNPPRNWVILIFSGQKPCTRKILTISHSFLHFSRATDQCSTFRKKILGPAGPQVFIFGRQNKT